MNANDKIANIAASEDARAAAAAIVSINYNTRSSNPLSIALQFKDAVAGYVGISPEEYAEALTLWAHCTQSRNDSRHDTAQKIYLFSTALDDYMKNGFNPAIQSDQNVKAFFDAVGKEQAQGFIDAMEELRRSNVSCIGRRLKAESSQSI